MSVSRVTLSDASEAPEMVPLNEICGYASGGIAAYSNHNAEHMKIVKNYDGKFFTGHRWQCVEFARRWLLERKGLVLQQYAVAAHIMFGSEVHDLEGAPVRAVPCKNGGESRPEPDTLIIYPMHTENFPGHIGVITEVGEDYVGVADQNRYFHSWGDKLYSARFPLECVDGKYFIRDPECECSGWITFPDTPNRPEGERVEYPENAGGPAGIPVRTHLRFFARAIIESPQRFHLLAVFTRTLFMFQGMILRTWFRKKLGWETEETTE